MLFTKLEVGTAKLLPDVLTERTVQLRLATFPQYGPTMFGK